MKHRITTTLLTLGTCASLLAVPAWADTTSGAGNASSGAASAETAFPTTEGTIDTSLTGTVRLDYQDADEEGSAPVAGAEFTFYKVADIDTVLTEEQETASKAEKAASKAESAASSAKADTGSAAESTAESTISTAEKSVLLKGAVLVPLIDGVEISADTDPASIEEEVVKAYQSDVEKGATYTGTTGKDGTATVTDMDLGAYLAVETKPAAEHFASTPFLFMLPYTTGGTTWTYGVSAQPKPLPAGRHKGNGQVRRQRQAEVRRDRDDRHDPGRHDLHGEGVRGQCRRLQDDRDRQYRHDQADREGRGGFHEPQGRDADPEQDGLPDAEDHDVHADHAVRPDARAEIAHLG